MSILSRIFRKSKPAPPSEHAVIVHFDFGETSLDPIFELEDQLETVIADASAGELDGHEVAIDGSDGYLYMYGPDGDLLFAVVRPILEAAPFMAGARVQVRYGPPAEGVPEVAHTIDSLGGGN